MRPCVCGKERGPGHDWCWRDLRLSKRVSIYVAGPYASQPNRNVLNAVNAADRLARRGYYVYVPHLNHLWDLIIPHGAEFWLHNDLFWLRKCDAMVRLPGDSPGADVEEDCAREERIPVVTMEEALA